MWQSALGFVLNVSGEYNVSSSWIAGHLKMQVLHLKLQKPYAKWHCVTTKKTCIISIIAVRFETLTANILAKAILCTWKSKTIWMRIWRICTHKKKSGFPNTYKTLVYAAPYLKMLSAAQNYSMANRQCVKYNLRFYCCPCFWENLLLSLLNHPLITLSYWPLVSITLTIKLLQLSNWYLRQYSSMSNKVMHSKETNIIFKMTTFWVGRVA